MVTMTLPLHHAAERPFCVCQLLHFCQLLSKPSIDLELEYIFRNQWNVDSNAVLFVRKYYQLFTHESNTYLLQNMPLKPLGQWEQTTTKSILPLEACGPPSNTWMPWVTLLTTPNNSSITVHIPHNYATKAPLVTMGWPKCTPKLPLTLRRSTPQQIHPSLNWPHWPPKRHLDPISRFATIHFMDRQRQTDRQTDGPGECSVTWMLCSLCW